MNQVSLIKEKGRILGTKVALEKYHLVVVMEKTVMIVIIAVRRNWTIGNIGILKSVEK